MGFREQILKKIEKQICENLVLEEDPFVRFQNDIPGYQELNRLRNITSDHVLSLTGSTVKDHLSFLSPRKPQNSDYNSILRAFYCRPINQRDITGLERLSSTSKPLIETPSAFLSFNTSEKDIYWPQRNNPASARLKDQVEYMKINIDCVFRDETEGLGEPNYEGNGKYWKEQTRLCKDLNPLDEITIQHPSNLAGQMYRPEYHKTINQQVAQFIEDIERLLNPNNLRTDTYKYGPSEQYEARVMNTNLAIWGMLPDSQNSPTDTVRAVFEVEVHYPKVPDC